MFKKWLIKREGQNETIQERIEVMKRGKAENVMQKKSK